MPVGARLHPVEDHPGNGLDLMHLTGREDDRVSAAESSLRAPVVEETFSLDDVVDLVGPGAGVDGGDLPRLPARDADVGVGVVVSDLWMW